MVRDVKVLQTEDLGHGESRALLLSIGRSELEELDGGSQQLPAAQEYPRTGKSK